MSECEKYYHLFGNNYESADIGIRVCKHDHEGGTCVYKTISGDNLLRLIEEYSAAVATLTCRLDQLKCAHSDMAELYRKSQIELEKLK